MFTKLNLTTAKVILIVSSILVNAAAVIMIIGGVQ